MTANTEAIKNVEDTLQAWRTDDELRKARTMALGIAIDVAHHRAQASGDHPGADAILKTAGEFFDFIWNGGDAK